MYPLGVLTEPAPKVRPGRPFSGLNPQQRAIVHEGLEIASTPILLVHGVGDNHSIFAVLDRALRQICVRVTSRYAAWAISPCPTTGGLPSRSPRRYASSVRIRGSLLARNLDLAPPSNRNDTALT